MPRRAYVVGLAGGSGSGKTTLARALRDCLPAGTCGLVTQDDYYHPIEAQQRDANGRVNFDLPGAVDLDALARDLDLLAHGVPVERGEYTFNNPAEGPRTVVMRPSPVLVVEGLFLLHHPPVRERLDLRVFVEASEERQLARRLRRDALERGYGEDDVRYQWQHHVLPAYRNYLLPHRHLCDLHVVNETGLDRAVRVLGDHLRRVAGLPEEVAQRS